MTAAMTSVLALALRKSALLCLTPLLGCGEPTTTLPFERGARPNVVLIVADDLGWGDLGCYGAADVRSPRIDALAAQGVRATDFYVASPMCSSSRASVLTGRIPQRHGLLSALVTADPREGLRTSETLLPERLRACGYATGLIGKWHLGTGPQFLPRKRGFDEFFGSLCASSGYFTHSYQGRPDLYRNEEPVAADGIYITSLLADESVAFLERHADDRFFLQVSFTAPHLADDRASLPTPPEHRARFDALAAPEERKDFLAAVAALDEAVGRVLDAIDRLDLAESTLVMLMSDNGPRAPWGSTGPFRGGKDGLDEGGLRVPFLARWPGRLPAGRVCTEPFTALDLLPTILSEACPERPLPDDLDGTDILPLLATETDSPHEALFWIHTSKQPGFDGRPEFQRVVREGRWRLSYSSSAGIELHDLVDDPGQLRNRAADEPERVDRLSSLLDAHLASLTPR